MLKSQPLQTTQAYLSYVEKYPELKEQQVVLPLCGAGIKSN